MWFISRFFADDTAEAEAEPKQSNKTNAIHYSPWSTRRIFLMGAIARQRCRGDFGRALVARLEGRLGQGAQNRIERLVDRLELTLRQIKEVEAAHDAVLKKPAPADEAERMIRSLVDMRAIGPELATALSRSALAGLDLWRYSPR